MGQVNTDDEDVDGHQLGRAFWLYADLPADTPTRPVTFDLRVLNWRRADAAAPTLKP